ncbi:MAG: tyrosine/phenylalanine carboxypeptidase domain-containing protein [Patescibacteria group bacterium]
MGLIADLKPLNFLEEKNKFLAEPNFNPQFIYSRIFSPKELTTHGLPNHQYINLAEKILEKTFHEFTNHELTQFKGQLLSQETVTNQITEFLKKHQIENKYKIVWAEDFVSRTAINADTIKLRLPCSVYEDDLAGLIYHELGTHALRRVNYEQQPWFKKKKKCGFTDYLKTEEGLAVLHALYPRKQPLAYMAAINFLAVIKAQEESFLEVWQFINHYLEDDEKSFNIAFKKKRGLVDTSQPGGFTKDYVYFEGFVETVRFLLENDLPIKELYFGKLAYQDIDKAVTMNKNFKPLLPAFYTINPNEYKNKVIAIAKTNFLV